MTQGCRWQEKSFNVAVSENKPLNICRCGIEIHNVKYLYNGDILCQKCFSEKKSLRQRLNLTGLGFNTTKDKLYEFIDNKNFRQPTEVRSKGHWKKLLKQHGLTDDFDQKPKRPEDLRTPMQDFKPTDKRFIRDEILKELQEKGLRHKLIRRR